MRVIEANIGDSYHVHKAYTEWADDMKLEKPGIEIWLTRFSERNFFCHLGMHGKHVVGMVWGVKRQNVVDLEGFFVKKRFRGKLKVLRSLLLAVKKVMPQNGVLRATVPHAAESFLKRKGFRPRGILMERGVKGGI